MVRAPAVAKVALVEALPPDSEMGEPSVAPSARKVTVPVGLVPLTDADSVTGWFRPGVAVPAETLVEVERGTTVTVSVEAVAAVLLPSPA
ncbi:hypothetical protein ASC91_25755 [Pelomonas sp. Root1237]|nr:hypothetical protein ASC91_25755 [Pelomonas sp. Root1237]